MFVGRADSLHARARGGQQSAARRYPGASSALPRLKESPSTALERAARPVVPGSSKQTATVNITYLVGSRHENYGETGMAHLLEHMLFKGSPGHTNIPQELTEHGSRPNGSTSWDRTNYFESFSATDVNLEWAIKLESDRMVNSFIAKKDLDSEMTVVRNEFESARTLRSASPLNGLWAPLYDWHNYAKLPIGNRSDIENVPSIACKPSTINTISR